MPHHNNKEDNAAIMQIFRAPYLPLVLFRNLAALAFSIHGAADSCALPRCHVFAYSVYLQHHTAAIPHAPTPLCRKMPPLI